MRKIVLVVGLLLPVFLKAQVIITVAGNGTSGFSGDNSAATAAKINYSGDVVVDNAGNIYFSDYLNYRVRKVNTSGIITTVAGNGTSGYTGDGGQATLAELTRPYGLALDDSGNLFIADQYAHVVRKVNRSGIISAFAGNHISGFSGDSGAATLAKIYYPNYVCTDHHGNVYITDNGNHRIRKVDTAGIISTYAGIGSPGFSGDIGQATNAKLQYPAGIKMDNAGNMYIADGLNYRVRKISSSGVINTIAGTGTTGYSGMAMPQPWRQ